MQNIRIVLVQTSHPGNIGSAARAMKTMGLSRLYLVKPKSFPDPTAVALASGAQDILEQAVVTETFIEAVSDCTLVIGSSARTRSIPRTLVTPRQCAALCAEQADTQIALIFGQERMGLSNEALACCHYHVFIPANEAYPSLNLAAAVQIVCYELRVRLVEAAAVFDKKHDKYATIDQLEGFYQHLEKTLLEIQVLNPKSPRQLMPRLRRLFGRIRLEHMEVDLLRGILTKTLQYQARLKTHEGAQSDDENDLS